MCNNETWSDAGPAFNDLTLQGMMTSPELGLGKR